MASCCSVEMCELPVHRGVYCRLHYNRLRRHGDPQAGRTLDGAPLKYLLGVVLPYSGDECLVWPYTRGTDGRGQIRHQGKRSIVSRLVCEAIHGPPPTLAHQAAHTCGRGDIGCVSPKHIVWKTPAENQQDRAAHGTHVRGERHPCSKLTEDDAREILALQGVITQKELANRFGVSAPVIAKIHQRVRWAWVEQETSRQWEQKQQKR